MGMMATYEKGNGLRVRNEPSLSAETLRVMPEGACEPVEKVVHGWARLSDGWAMAEHLVIAVGDQAEASDGHGGPETGIDNAGEEQEAPDDVVPDDAGELESMTKDQLIDLAEQSGIETDKLMSKAQLIDAIVNG